MNNNKETSMSLNILASKIFRNVICIFLCFLSIIPFWMMIANATRTSVDIQASFSLIPSHYLLENYDKLMYQANQNVPLYRYMINSLIIAGFSTIVTVYFSTMTAYGVTVYKFRGSNAVWGFIMAIMMIPAQVSSIGFYKMVYSWGLSNSYIPLIIPAIAAPMWTVRNTSWPGTAPMRRFARSSAWIRWATFPAKMPTNWRRTPTASARPASTGSTPARRPNSRTGRASSGAWRNKRQALYDRR